MIFSDAAFLSDFWRQQPCFDPASITALPDVGPAELLALAGDDLVESRLIGPDYSLTTGPMTLTSLPSGSMLMINGLEQHVDSLAMMLTREFGFLPRWRVDDVMASYGDDQASCGPHFDHYDVFLLQLRGTKRWHLDQGGHRDDELDADCDIRLLGSLASSVSYDASPGDVLYIPPGFGHWGIAGAGSITLSIGIRNPTTIELLAELTDFLLAGQASVQTVDETLQRPGDGISMEDVNHLRKALVSMLDDATAIADCYGEYSTRPREPDLVEPGRYDERASVIRLHHYARITWHQGEDPPGLRVYANGESLTASDTVLDWLRPLTIHRQYTFAHARTPSDHKLLAELALTGALSIGPPEARHG